MGRFAIKNPLAKRQVNSNDTVLYERPTVYEPRLDATLDSFEQDKAPMYVHQQQRTRCYLRALVCVAIAAVLVLMLILGIPDQQSSAIKFLLGFGFVAFAVISVHYAIAAVTMHDNDGDFTPGRSRRF